jgi:hypothetical protein
MAKIAPKPKADSDRTPTVPHKEIERMADAFINKGGKAIAVPQAPIAKGMRTSRSSKSNPDELVGITVKLLVSERDIINQLRTLRPRRGRVPSIDSWILEAVQEKIKRESKHKI